MFAETSTLGLRINEAERRVQARRWVEVETAHGKIRVKVAADGSFAPEYEDCREIALATGVPLKHIIAAANYQYLSNFEMKYYLTTPLYYVNAAPHIGHTYSTLAADTIKRFRRMLGDEVFLTTGTDEHGQKVERSALAAGKTPEAFADAVSGEYRRQWDTLGIGYDAFHPNHGPEASRDGADAVSAVSGQTDSFTRAVTRGSTASSMSYM